MFDPGDCARGRGLRLRLVIAATNDLGLDHDLVAIGPGDGQIIGVGEAEPQQLGLWCEVDCIFLFGGGRGLGTLHLTLHSLKDAADADVLAAGRRGSGGELIHHDPNHREQGDED